MIPRSILTLVVANVLIPLAHAADWPQWRGPNRDGISTETGLLQQWPEEGPKLLWQQNDLGEGYGSPAIAGGRIFLVNNRGNDDEYVQAVSAKDGKPLWSTKLGKVGSPEQFPRYTGARSTPTVDGNLVFAFSSDGDLACVEAATGNVKWKKNVKEEFGGKPGIWAYSESPLVDGEAVVVSPGGKEATILALNKTTGEVLWKSPVPGGDPAGYASIIVMQAAGRNQYVQFLGKGLVGVDAKTGEFLWRYDHTAKGSPANILTPVAADGCVYTGTHYSGGGLVKLVAAEGKIEAEEVYFDRKLPKAIGGAVLLGDYLYGTGGELTQCVEFKSGEVKWTKNRAVSPASLCVAEGRLYLHGEKEGEVSLLEASPEGYQEHGRFTLPDQPANRVGKSWEYPAISNGCLYIHSWGTLWCYDIKADGPRTASGRGEPTKPNRN
ncbi:MAG: PQQ-like beta-propeller repeat protein [Pirellulales bacterium]|nr:PQQ-like beta-propeller repeat protein [Pirellulales bacterium]